MPPTPPHHEITKSGGYASTTKEENGWEDEGLGGGYDGCGDRVWWVEGGDLVEEEKEEETKKR
jgi:hypothetical protein